VKIEGCLFDYIENDHQEIIILSFKKCIVRYIDGSNNQKHDLQKHQPETS